MTIFDIWKYKVIESMQKLIYIFALFSNKNEQFCINMAFKLNLTLTGKVSGLFDRNIVIGHQIFDFQKNEILFE